MLALILSGWKSIAEYMRSSVRTVQRWEGKGLPVRRPTGGLRSHVVARSEEIDHWIEHRDSEARAGAADLRSSLRTARKLRHEVKCAREELHSRMAALRKQLAEIRAKRRHGD
jgi:phage terminase Nu1 subunit (DNA packaging protein)